MRKWVPLVLLCACGRNHPGPAERYDQAVAAKRRGEFAWVLQQTAEGLKSVPPDSEWYWRFRLLRAEAALTAGSGQEAAVLLKEEPPDQPLYGPVHVRRSVLLASLSLRTRAPDFEQRLADARSRAKAAGDMESLCDLDAMEGQVAAGRDQWEAAESAFRSSIRCAGSYHQAVAWGNLGRLRQMLSRYDEALLYHQRAYAAAQRADAQALEAVTLGNQSVCAYSLGDFDRALDLRRQAFALQQRLGAGRNLANSLGELGTIYLLLGDLRKAVDYYQQALDKARELKADDIAAFWAGNMASARIELEDWQNADEWNRQARDLAERLKDNTGLLYADLNEGYIARGRGRFAEAARWFGQVVQGARNEPALEWEGRAALAGLHARTDDHVGAEREFRRALALIESRREGLSRPEYKITFLSRLIRFYQEFVDALVAQGRASDALAIADSSRARMLAPASGSGHGDRRPVAGELLLAYWLAPRNSYLWAVNPSGVQLFRLPPKQEIEALAAAHQGAVTALRDPVLEGSESSRRLSDLLLAPVRELSPPGTRVILIPDGALHGLNFETLASPHDPSRRWIEDVTLAIAPSLSVLSRAAAGVPGTESMLLIGDPVAVDPSFPALPHAAREIDSVTRRMASVKVSAYRGADARPEILRAAKPDRFRWIHFTAHASANRESPLDSAVILSPPEHDGTAYKLYAREAMHTALTAELVTVSACRGAGARAYAGEGLVGFAWAFLMAGAANVVAGLWDVTDASTAQLMDTFYAGIASGKPPAAALREAKLAMIRGGGNYAKPYYWAPFQTYTRYHHQR